MAHDLISQPTIGSAREFALASSEIERWRRDRPLLRGLLAVAAGFGGECCGQGERDCKRRAQVFLVYCVRGDGWCKLAGRFHAVHQGDLVLAPPGCACRFGRHSGSRWALHWLRAVGDHLPEYIRSLPVGPLQPVLPVGDDARILRLFNEILRSLQHASSYANLLRASHALGYLFSLLIEWPARNDTRPNTVQKVAEAINYMSEHVGESLRMGALARMAGLSSDYFAQLFKQQTGSPPREYLHLLRIHRACQLLRGSTLSVKEVASRVGYSDPFHFSRQFKAFQGWSPSDYRRTGPV
ncbi:MAG TPA: AraC family transcriptional regulator [Verrucomicrobiae bacterium]